jgi:hypothetical protein
MPFKNIVPPTTNFINAVAEMTEAADAVIPMAFVEDWLEKYTWHYEQFSLPPLPGFEDESICTFHSLYYYFFELDTYYRQRSICLQAVQEYQDIVAANASIHGNEALTEWVRRYEKIGTQDLILYPSDDDSVNLVRTIDDTVYVVSYNEFSSIDKFKSIFDHLFYEEQLLPESIKDILRNGE